MRSLVLVALFAGVVTVAGVLRFAEPGVSAAALTPATVSVPVSPADAVTSAVMQEGPKVTVRVGGGRDNVKIGPSSEGNGRKGRVQDPGLGADPDRPGIGDAGDPIKYLKLTVEGRGVSMADRGTSGEGSLTRIHVDADDGLTAVIGFYSKIDGERPVDNPRTYSCRKCGPVLVCGVEPQCAN